MQRRTFLLSTVTAVASSRLAAAAAKELPFRQIHLDFHTSEHIPDIGADFDGAEFAATLKKARVNSINVFAKCHHGWSYYDAKVGRPHPHLKKDLLGEMVKHCRANAIDINYYYSLVWDVDVARRHPEWLWRDRDGKPVGDPLPAWPNLCMNTPYLDLVVRENEEILSKYETDGAWFDILKQPPQGCYCAWCRKDRAELGLAETPAGIRRHNKTVAMRVEKRLNGIVHQRFPNALTFYNSRLVVGVRDELPYYSHIEIESLPTGGWGYSHFQQRVRYMRTLGKDMVGMTGRFHKSWGDFGGIKNQAALDFECTNFLANGAKACVGDQLHPRGRLDAVTYNRIGRTYAKVEALEPWCRGTAAVADIGVVSTAVVASETTQKITPVDQGFTNMLVELHQQFNVLDLDEDLARYKVVIVPDEIPPFPALVEKLDRYVAAGGALIVSHESLLDPATRQFALKQIGVRYQGPAKFEGEYLALKPGAFPGIDEQNYFLYQRGVPVTAEPGTEVLATYAHPYFDRSAERFSSHKQTPPGPVTDEPVITRRGRVTYIANPFFRSYSEDAYGVNKLLIARLIGAYLSEPSLRTSRLPSNAQATLLRQGARRIVHLLYYPLTRRAPNIDMIEEAGLLERVGVAVRMEKAPSKVTLVPQGKPLEFRFEGGYARVEVPRVEGHQAVCFESA